MTIVKIFVYNRGSKSTDLCRPCLVVEIIDNEARSKQTSTFKKEAIVQSLKCRHVDLLSITFAWRALISVGIAQLPNSLTTG